MYELNDELARIIEGNRKVIVANHNLHSIYLFHSDAKMREFYSKAELIHADGMPLVIWARFLGYNTGRKHRITYADWLWSLMHEAALRKWRVFYLGSRPHVVQKGSERLKAKYPGLSLAVHTGYFDHCARSDGNAAVLSAISSVKPHLLLVGMGMPKQEHWILENLPNINANVILTSGAAMDYVAGAVATPPRWLAALGLEWLCRLLNEPRRLWSRYLVEPWFLKGHLLRDIRRMHRVRKQPARCHFGLPKEPGLQKTGR